MPFSYATFDERLKTWLLKTKPGFVIDVGVGAGRIGNLVKQTHKCVMRGYEVDAEYLQTYQDQHRCYDELVRMDFYDVVLKEDIRCDVYIFGDVLEHFPLSRTLDILDYAVYRSKYVLVSSPLLCSQGNWEHHISERHLCQLRLFDVASRFDVREYAKDETAPNLHMQFFALKGCL
jgi:hypothetical protein